MALERTLTLSFSWESWETWETTVNNLGTMFVRILPTGGGAPFDAYIVKVDDETDDVHDVKIMRGTPESGPNGTIETVSVEKIHVY